MLHLHARTTKVVVLEVVAGQTPSWLGPVTKIPKVTGTDNEKYSDIIHLKGESLLFNFCMNKGHSILA